MKQILLFLSLIFSLGLRAQSLKTVTLVEQRTYSLNGGARAAFGGRSREAIRVDLPKNTQKWYYSFTTSPGVDGTKLLNLGIQLSAVITSGGLSAMVTSDLKVPSGSSSIDVYVLPVAYKDQFINKEEGKWQVFQDVSIENATQAVQDVDAKYGSSFYLGLKNPSAMNGINITIEVVAIVEEDSSNTTDKGILYGNLGWQAFKNGDLDKSVELSKKALTFSPNLCFVKFNIALVHLVQEKDEAVDDYIDAIADIKNDKTPNQTLRGALQDVLDLEAKNVNLKNLQDIKNLLIAELNKY